MTPSTFHYSPYLVDSSAESGTWVATVGTVFSYGIPVEDEDEGALGMGDAEPELEPDQFPLPLWPQLPPAGASELMS